MKKHIFLSLFVAAFFMIAASSALACSCMAPGPDVSVKQQVADSKTSSQAVFAGKVISVRVDAGMLYATFKVERSWKGVTGTSVVIATSSEGAMCGVSFEAGKSYIVYANTDGKSGFAAYNCSRTAEFATARSADEKYLGKKIKIVTK